MASVTNGSVDQPGGGTRTNFPQFFMTIDRAYKIPRSYNWNLSYQRELGWDTTLELGYVGTTGNYLAREQELNQLRTGTTFERVVSVHAAQPPGGNGWRVVLERSGRARRDPNYLSLFSLWPSLKYANVMVEKV